MKCRLVEENGKLTSVVASTNEQPALIVADRGPELLMAVKLVRNPLQAPSEASQSFIVRSISRPLVIECT